MLAMLRTAKASPGCRPRVTDGHTRESEQANTMYCKCTQPIHGRQEKENSQQPAGGECTLPIPILKKKLLLLHFGGKNNWHLTLLFTGSQPLP